MAPEIVKNGVKIADVPDKTGTYLTLNGTPIYVNTDQIDSMNDIQRIILESDEIGGRRILGLTQEGLGRSCDRKRGDQMTPELRVILKERPIRVSYKRKERQWHSRTHDWGLWGEPRRKVTTIRKETYHNPNWRNGYKGR